jgi:hypothetical protein
MQDPEAYAKMRESMSAADWDKKRYHDVVQAVRQGDMKAIEVRQKELEQEMEQATNTNDTVAISRIKKQMRSLGYLHAPEIHGD